MWNAGKNRSREKRKFWAWIESKIVQRAECKHCLWWRYHEHHQLRRTECIRSFKVLSYFQKQVNSNIFTREQDFIIQSGGVSIIWLVLMMTIDWDLLLQCAQNTLILVNILILGVLQRFLWIQNWTTLEHISQLFVSMVLRYRSNHWINQTVLHRLWYAEDLRDSWMSCISMTVKLVTQFFVVQPKKWSRTCYDGSWATLFWETDTWKTGSWK